MVDKFSTKNYNMYAEDDDIVIVEPKNKLAKRMVCDTKHFLNISCIGSTPEEQALAKEEFIDKFAKESAKELRKKLKKEKETAKKYKK